MVSTVLVPWPGDLGRSLDDVLRKWEGEWAVVGGGHIALVSVVRGVVVVVKQVHNTALGGCGHCHTTSDTITTTTSA